MEDHLCRIPVRVRYGYHDRLPDPRVVEVSAYLDELTAAMAWLESKDDVLFIGQSVSCDGTPIRKTFEGVRPEKMIEFPVAENLQMGVSIGLSLEGFVPVSVFPRWNFLILASDQLVNHLDR